MARLVIENFPDGGKIELVGIAVRSALIKHLALSEDAVDNLLARLPATISDIPTEADASALVGALQQLGVKAKLCEDHITGEELTESTYNLDYSEEASEDDPLQALLSLLDKEISPKSPTPDLSDNKLSSGVKAMQSDAFGLISEEEALDALNDFLVSEESDLSAPSSFEISLANDFEAPIDSPASSPEDIKKPGLADLDDYLVSEDQPLFRNNESPISPAMGLGKTLSASESLLSFDDAAPLSAIFKTAAAQLPSAVPAKNTSPSKLNYLEEEGHSPDIENESTVGFLTKDLPAATPISDNPASAGLASTNQGQERPPANSATGLSGLSFDSYLSDETQPTPSANTSTESLLEITPELQELDSTLHDLSKLLDGALGKPTESSHTTARSEAPDLENASPKTSPKPVEDDLESLLSFDSDEVIEVPPEKKQPNKEATPHREPLKEPQKETRRDTSTGTSSATASSNPPSAFKPTSAIPSAGATNLQQSNIHDQHRATAPETTSTNNVTKSAVATSKESPESQKSQTPVATRSTAIQASDHSAPQTDIPSKENLEALFHGKTTLVSRLKNPVFALKVFGGILLALAGVATLIYSSLQPTLVVHTGEVTKLLKEQKEILEPAAVEKPKPELLYYKGTYNLDKIHGATELSLFDHDLNSLSLTLSQDESPTLTGQDVVKGRKRTAWLKSLELIVTTDEAKSLKDVKKSADGLEFSSAARAYFTDGDGHTRVVVSVKISVKPAKGAETKLLVWEITGGDSQRITTINSAQRTSATAFNLNYQGAMELQRFVPPPPPPPTPTPKKVDEKRAKGTASEAAKKKDTPPSEKKKT